MATIQSVDAKIDGHIDVCAVRYEGIENQMRGVNARLKRIEQIGMTVAGAILLMLIKLVFNV
jgi:hypothetical protein